MALAIPATVLLLMLKNGAKQPECIDWKGMQKSLSN